MRGGGDGRGGFQLGFPKPSGPPEAGGLPRRGGQGARGEDLGSPTAHFSQSSPALISLTCQVGGGSQVRFHIREWPQDNDAKDPKSRRSSGVKVLVQTHSAVPQAASMCAGGHRIMDGASPHAWHFSAQLTQPAQGTRASPDPCVSCGLLSSHERS